MVALSKNNTADINIFIVLYVWCVILVYRNMIILSRTYMKANKIYCFKYFGIASCLS